MLLTTLSFYFSKYWTTTTDTKTKTKHLSQNGNLLCDGFQHNQGNQEGGDVAYTSVSDAYQYNHRNQEKDRVA